MTPIDSAALHDEVLAALRAVAPSDPDVGERVRMDRRSELEHLGVRTPARRQIAKRGFAFTTGSDADVLAAWDSIWKFSNCADVMFTVLDYYRERLPFRVPPDFWETARTWIDRVDNWAHADDLARIYSWALAADQSSVYPELETWNQVSGVWERRISIVSLVHYSGKHAFFMPIDRVLPLLANCVEDPRPDVQKALGWVLREAGDAHPKATEAFLHAHLGELPSATLRRATSHFPADDQVRLRELAAIARRAAGGQPRNVIPR